MQYEYKAGKGITLTNELRAYVEKRLNNIHERDVDTRVEVELEFLDHEVPAYRVELMLNVPGKQVVRAEAVESELTAAIDVATDLLERTNAELNKKKRDLVRRGAAAIKNMMRFGR